MLGNLRNVLAIELLAACQGIDLLAPLATGAQAAKAQAMVRAESKMVEADRSLAPDIRAVEQADCRRRLQQNSALIPAPPSPPTLCERLKQKCTEAVAYCVAERRDSH